MNQILALTAAFGAKGMRGCGVVSMRRMPPLACLENVADAEVGRAVAPDCQLQHLAFSVKLWGS